MCPSSLPLDKALSQTHSTSAPEEFSHILPWFRRELQWQEDSEKSELQHSSHSGQSKRKQTNSQECASSGGGEERRNSSSEDTATTRLSTHTGCIAQNWAKNRLSSFSTALQSLQWDNLTLRHYKSDQEKAGSKEVFRLPQRRRNRGFFLLVRLFLPHWHTLMLL